MREYISLLCWVKEVPWSLSSSHRGASRFESTQMEGKHRDHRMAAGQRDGGLTLFLVGAKVYQRPEEVVPRRHQS